jgi:hypothetical protein
MIFGFVLLYNERLIAQEGPTATAAPITIPLAATPTSATEVPTLTPMPTMPQGAFLEAITEANVRSEADPGSDLLGTIRSGETYPVIGRYFRWYRFRFPLSPDGAGWVFEELVTVSGDTANITDLASLPTATLDSTEAARNETLEAVTLTPGSIFTLTAEAVLLPLPVQGETQEADSIPSDSVAPLQIEALPTFTPPPNVALLPPENAYSVNRSLNPSSTITDESSISRQQNSTVPPILPIGLLIGAGILGLLISVGMRR